MVWVLNTELRHLFQAQLGFSLSGGSTVVSKRRVKRFVISCTHYFSFQIMGPLIFFKTRGLPIMTMTKLRIG